MTHPSPTRSMPAMVAAARFLLSLAVLAACLGAAPRGADALRSLGVEGASTADGDAAVHLDASNFTGFLQASPESFAVVVFSAHWCPACRRYKLHYEKVAKLFNGPDAAHPRIVVMAWVDCASKVNVVLCNKFSVDHYPFLVWGPPIKFDLDQWKPKQENSELELIDDGRTADRLLKWINNKMESSFNLDDKKYENERMPHKVQMGRAVYDVEEVTAHAFQIIGSIRFESVAVDIEI